MDFFLTLCSPRVSFSVGRVSDKCTSVRDKHGGRPPPYELARCKTLAVIYLEEQSHLSFYTKNKLYVA